MSLSAEDTHWVLLFLIGLYFFVCFLWRTIAVWKATGKSPLVLGRGDDAYDHIGRLFKLTAAVTFAHILALAIWPSLASILGSLTWLELDSFRNAGLALIVLSTVWTAVAQRQMGLSWRIGIDHNDKTELVRRGVFRFSRNPIFLGMNVAMMGIFLVVPNAVSLLLLCLTHVLMSIQVRLEEVHLLKSHGEEYQAYCERVRRWL